MANKSRDACLPQGQVKDGKNRGYHSAVVGGQGIDCVSPITEIAEQAMKEHNGWVVGITRSFVDEAKPLNFVYRIGGVVHEH